MSDPKDRTSAENQTNREEITTTDATEERPRGNVHSEPEEPVDQDVPPPLPN